MGYEPGLVSIIMPSYNTARFISESINSIISQTYSNWELMIVDDCSTDNTDEVVASFKDERIRYLKNEKNSGAAVSRNKALREAKGEWIAFLDSDDLWMPEKLEKQINFMKKNNYSFTCTYNSYIDEQSNSLGKMDICPSHIGKMAMKVYNWIGCLTVMFNQEKIGVIQIPDIKKRNDYAIWLKAIEKDDCYCLKENLASYRVRTKSISHDSMRKLIVSFYTLHKELDNKCFIYNAFLSILNLGFMVIRKLFFVKSIR